MSKIIKPSSGLIFMKVGIHDGESFESILERKREEYKKTGMVWWGYGGSTCHPTRQVQPFARMKIEEGENIFLVMHEINSRHQATNMLATEYSPDGIQWLKIPDGIKVTGSKYAIILDELVPGDLDYFDLAAHEVALGKSRGKIAEEYIQGHVDKACFVQSKEPKESSEDSKKKISLVAKLRDPFAVFVR